MEQHNYLSPVIWGHSRGSIGTCHLLSGDTHRVRLGSLTRTQGHSPARQGRYPVARDATRRQVRGAQEGGGDGGGAERGGAGGH